MQVEDGKEVVCVGKWARLEANEVVFVGVSLISG